MAAYFVAAYLRAHKASAARPTIPSAAKPNSSAVWECRKEDECAKAGVAIRVAAVSAIKFFIRMLLVWVLRAARL